MIDSSWFSPANLISQGLAPEEANAFSQQLAHWAKELAAPALWQKITQELLTPAHPFSLHEYLFQQVYGDEPLPWAWIPTPEQIEQTHIHAFLQKKGWSTYQELYHWSLKDKNAFWQEVTEQLGIRFRKEAQAVLDPVTDPSKTTYFPGAEFNIYENCFQADSQAVAISFANEEGQEGQWTFQELQERSDQVARSLLTQGVKKGQTIGIDMLMTAESVAIYLGIIKIGAVAVSIADSFAPEEIRTRLRISEAQWVFTQDAIFRAGKQLPLYQKVVDAGAAKIVVLSGSWDASAELTVSLRESDQNWEDFLAAGKAAASSEPVSCQAMDPINILFSSGTTGDPKAIPWNHSTPIKAAMDGYFHHDIHAGDCVAWPTNLGWMMGPWLIFAALVNKASIALFYGTPTGRPFGEFIEKQKVSMLGLVPSIVKAWKASGCMQGLDWSSLRCFSSTGEVSNAQDYLFLMSLVKSYRPVMEYCGGTEIGGGYVTGSMVQPQSPATFSTPCLGLGLHLLDEQGKAVSAEKEGEVFLEGPSIGLSTTLLNRDHHKVYYQGLPPGPNGQMLRRHGDQMRKLAGGYYRAQGRADDTMNLGGIKTSSAEIERVLNQLEGVLETAAIAVPPPGGGPSLLVIFAVLEKDLDLQELQQCMQKQMKEKLNPLFKIHELRSIDKLPRTASNKVMRRVLRDSTNQGKK